MRLRPQIPSVLAVLTGASVLALGAGSTSCRDAEPECTREPTGSITAYMASDPEAMHYAATVRVESVSAFDEQGMQRLVVRDTSGAALDTLAYGAPPEAGAPSLPVQEGDVIDLVLDHVGGFPSASGILIRDDGGLRFLGVADQRPGQTVLKGGIPGWDLALGAGTCESRPHDECYDAVINAPLRVAHDADTLQVYHGESGKLGAWRVSCYTAQRVDYTSNCADAGLVGVSYTIDRAPEPAAPAGGN